MSQDIGKEEKYIKMTQTPETKLVIEFAIPAVIIMIITSIYNIVNSYFVGKLGTNEAAAVQLVFPVMIIIQAIGLFFGQGAGNFISREMGAKSFDKVAKMASTGFYSTIILGVLLAALGTAFLKPFAVMLGANQDTLQYAEAYLRLILWSTPFMASALVLNVILRFQGYASLGMVGIVSGAVLCSILDPLLIIVLQLGVSGASLSTFISQFVSFVILLVGSFKAGGISIKLRDFTPSLYYMKEMARGGLPSLIKQGLTAVASFLMNKVAGSYDVSVVAAVGYVQRISVFAASAVAGLGQGLQPVCGFNYGAKMYDRVKKSFWFAIKLGTGIMLALSLAGIFFAPQLIKFFRDDPEVIKVGAFMLRAQSLTYPLMPIATIGSMFLQTLGKATRASLLAVARQGMFLIPALLLMTKLFDLVGFQISQPVADLLAFALGVFFIVGVFREMDRFSQEAKRV